MTDHDAEADAIVAVLEAAGLITVEVRADGEESYVLTPDGESVARQLAMSSEDGAAALLDALLEPDRARLTTIGPWCGSVGQRSQYRSDVSSQTLR